MARDFSHRPPRGEGYHESAIIYNEEMAKRAMELASEVEDKEVQRWCRAVARQHEEHTVFHRKSLHRLRKQKQKDKPKNARRPKSREPKQTIAEEQAEFAKEQEAARGPIPRDPRAGKKAVAPESETGVETDFNEDEINEKQEASA